MSLPMDILYLDVCFQEMKGKFIEVEMYTGTRWVTLKMEKKDYELLITDRFFIKDGKTTNEFNDVNTTSKYEKIKKEKN